MSVNRPQGNDRGRSAHLEGRDGRGGSEGATADQGPQGSNAEARYDSRMDSKWLTREDLQDIAKIGGDLLKRTVVSGIEVIKEVKDGLPKEATNLIAKGKDEVLRGLSKEVAQSLLTGAVDRFFATVREHRVEVSIRLRRDPDLVREREAEELSRREARRAQRDREKEQDRARDRGRSAQGVRQMSGDEAGEHHASTSGSGGRGQHSSSSPGTVGGSAGTVGSALRRGPLGARPTSEDVEDDISHLARSDRHSRPGRK